MKLLLENWRKYQTLCEVESKYNPKILEEISNIVDENGVLDEGAVLDLAKKLGLTVRDLRAAALGLTVAGGMTGGLGTYAADVMRSPGSIETHQVEPEHKGRQARYTSQGKVEMDPSLNWQRAPTARGALYVAYNDISDRDVLPSVNMNKTDYLNDILWPMIEKEVEAGKTGKEALESMLYDSEGPWAYRASPGQAPGPAFDKHPEIGVDMLPLAWSVAYELYRAL